LSPRPPPDTRPVVDAWAEFEGRRERHEFWHPTGPWPSAGLDSIHVGSLAKGVPTERVSLTTRARPPTSPRWTIRGLSPRPGRPQSAAARAGDRGRGLDGGAVAGALAPGGDAPTAAGARPRPQSARPPSSAGPRAVPSARDARPSTAAVTTGALAGKPPSALTRKAERGIEAYLDKKKRPASAGPAFARWR